MPLETQIERNGQLLPLRWGWWHVHCMVEAAKAEGVDLHSTGTHTLSQEHTFTDPADGEVLKLQPGDTLRMFR